MKIIIIIIIIIIITIIIIIWCISYNLTWPHRASDWPQTGWPDQTTTIGQGLDGPECPCTVNGRYPFALFCLQGPKVLLR